MDCPALTVAGLAGSQEWPGGLDQLETLCDQVKGYAHLALGFRRKGGGREVGEVENGGGGG